MLCLLLITGLLCQITPTMSKPVPADKPAGSASLLYLLGPRDSVTVKVLDLDEIGTIPYAVDLNGQINLPLVGLVQASGLTVDQLQADLTRRLKDYLLSPRVTVAIAEFRSQPVSVLGAVTSPGVHQLQGQKRLFEVISEAGGLKPEAGNLIKITRDRIFGDVPLPGATTDPTGTFSVGQVNIRSIMEAENPNENIVVKPNDVISVPKAELIYVIGDVKKPGGFPLTERPSISVLEALSLAEGLQQTAAGKGARILRAAPGSVTRTETPLDVKKILTGQDNDISLLPNDILFVPSSSAKTLSARAIEAMIQVGTGIAIYSHF